MSIKVRRIISLIFIALFFLATPVVILYAAGYKLNLANANFQKTGIFILDSHPGGAKIFINNKPQQNFLNKVLAAGQPNYITTPAKIKNLLPGEYNIRMELGGYWPWEKKLTIYPGAATYAEDVYLFKQDLPILIYQTAATEIALSPDRRNLAVAAADQLDLINLDSQLEQTAPATSSSKISWSADSQKIITDNFIYSAENLTDKINFKNLNITGSTNFFWADNSIYYELKNSIFAYSLSDKSSRKIASAQQIDDYLIKDGYLYLVDDAKQSAILKIYKLGSLEPAGNINLPALADYKFINIGQKIINLYDQNQRTLYLIDPLASLPTLKINAINDVKYIYWINDEKLIYANDFEIWLANVSSGDKALLTRISESITGLAWHPSNNYIIYSTDKTINTIEMDLREKRNTTELIKFDKISSLVINPQGNVLYFLAKIGNQEGLYKLAVQ